MTSQRPTAPGGGGDWGSRGKGIRKLPKRRDPHSADDLGRLYHDDSHGLFE